VVITDTTARIEDCLTTVQKILEALTARADHRTAFDLAKAQYAASIRTSWPANLVSLTDVLEQIASDDKAMIEPAERDEIREAVATLRAICNQ
jgi:hypothetical protein